MLEGIVASIVEGVLGQYVEDSAYSSSTVQLGIWSGFVVLENLVLKSSVLDALKMPITVVHGIVGRVELRIPWSNIGNEPVVAIFDRIYLVMEPKFEWDPNARHTREQAAKQAKLASAEIFAKGSAGAEDPFHSYREFARTWLIEGLVHKLITNIEVHVREVHIRYEDRESCPTEFAMGITVESIHIQSAQAQGPEVDEKDAGDSVKSIDASTEQFNEAFPAASTEQTFSIQGTISNKLFIVNHFAVYWNPLRPDKCVPSSPAAGLKEGPSKGPAKGSANVNPCTCIYSLRSPVEMEHLLSKTIAKRNHTLIDRPRHHFMLHPMDMTTSIAFALDLSRSGMQPNLTSIMMCVMLNTKVDINATIADMQITVEDNQFREMLSLATNMANFAQLEEFSSFRPSVNVKYDPKAWWRYAIFATIHNIRKEGRTTRFRDIASRSRDKMVYMELWKAKIVANNKSAKASSRGGKAAAAPAAEAPRASSDVLATIRLLNPYSANGLVDPSSRSYIEIDEQLYQQMLRLYSQNRNSAGDGEHAGGLCYFSEPKYRLLYERLCGIGRQRRQQQQQTMATARAQPGGVQSSSSAAKPKPKSTPAPVGAAIPVQRFDSDMVRLLQEMEEKLSFEDIVYFRSLAEKELSETVSQQGWLTGVISWALTGSTGAAPGTVGAGGKGKQKRVSDEDQKRLIEALELGAKKGSPPSKPKPSVNANAPFIRMFMQLSRGSINLCLSTPNEGPSSSSAGLRSSYVPIALPFLAFELEKFNTGVLAFDGFKRLKSFMSLQDFEAYETLSADLEDEKVAIEARYRRLVSRRTSSSSSASNMAGVNVYPSSSPRSGSRSESMGDFPEFFSPDFSDGSGLGHPPPSPMLIARHRQSKRREQLGINEKRTRPGAMKPGDSGSGPSLSKFVLAPLLSTCIEIAPPSYGYEIGVNVSLDELEILISPSSYWMQSMIAFITWPEDMEYWSEMEMQVMNQVADWKTKFDMKLEHMMNNHMDIMMDMHIVAPVIVISESTDLYGSADAAGQGATGVPAGAGHTTPPSRSAPPKGSAHASSDVIIIDLGRIVLSTERLAKADHKKTIMENSAMTVCSASEYGGMMKMSNMSVMGGSGMSVMGGSGMSTTMSVAGRDVFSPVMSSPPPVPNSAALPRSPTMSLKKRLDAAKGGGIAISEDSFDEDDSDDGVSNKAASVASAVSDVVVSKKPAFNGDGGADVPAYAADATNPFESVEAAVQDATPQPSPPRSHGTATPDSFDYEGVLYDVFHVHISQVEVCLVNELDYKRKNWNVSGPIQPNSAHSNLQIAPARLVEKFDIFIEIEVSTLPWDTTLPPIKFTVDLPELHVQLSDDKFSRLIRFGDAISRNSLEMLQIGKEKADKFADAVERRKRGADALTSPMANSFTGRSGGAGGGTIVGGGVILSSSRGVSTSSYHSALNTPVSRRKGRSRSRSVGTSSVSSRGSVSDSYSKPRSARGSRRKGALTSSSSSKYLSSDNLSRAGSFLLSDVSGGESDSSDDLFFDAKSCMSGGDAMSVMSAPRLERQRSGPGSSNVSVRSRYRTRSGSFDSLARLNSSGSSRGGRASRSAANLSLMSGGSRRSRGGDGIRSSRRSSSSSSRGSDSDSDSDMSDISFVSAMEEGLFRGVYTPDLDGVEDETGGAAAAGGVAASTVFASGMLSSSLDERRREAESEVQRLQQRLQTQEKECAKYMADMRIVEKDAGKRRMLESIKEALAASVAGVRETKEQYVEALVTLESIRRRFGVDTTTQSGIRRQEDRLDDMFSGEAAYLGGPEINTKKYRPRYTVFKQIPSNRKRQTQLGERGGVGGNKELVYALVNFPEINIDISASNKNIDGKFVKRTSSGRASQKNFNQSFIRRSTVFSNANTDAEVDASYETPMIRIRAAGMSMEARHRAMDSKVKMIMREFDIIDLLASSMSTSAAGGNLNRTAQKYLISSEPNANSMMMPADHTQPSGAVDVLMIKYEVVFGSNLSDKNKAERFPHQRHRTQPRSGRGVDDEETGDEEDEDEEEDDEMEEVDNLRCAEHTLRVNMGFFEVNVDQNTLSCLLDCLHSVIRAHKEDDTFSLPSSKTKTKSANAAPPTPAALHRSNSNGSLDSAADSVVKPLESIVIVDARFKLGGFGVALMLHNTPILGVSLWSVQSRLKVDPDLAECHVEVTDCSIYQNYPTNGAGGPGTFAPAGSSAAPRHSNKQIIIGRTGSANLPSLRIDFQVSDFAALTAAPRLSHGPQTHLHDHTPPVLATVKGRVRTSPLQVTIIPWFVETVAKEVLGGKVLHSLLKIAAISRPGPDRGSKSRAGSEAGGSPSTSPPPTMAGAGLGAPGTPTRLNTMLNSTVLSGGMYDSGSTESTGTAVDQSTGSLASAAPAKMSPDDMMAHFLAVCNGRVVVDIGKVVVTVSNGLNRQAAALLRNSTAQARGGGGSQTQLPPGRFPFASLVYKMQSAQARVAWGSPGAVGVYAGSSRNEMFSFSLTVQDTEFRVNRNVIVDPYDCTFRLCLKPAAYPAGTASAAAGAGAGIPSVLLAANLSDVNFHVSTYILLALGQWALQNKEPLTSVGVICNDFGATVKEIMAVTSDAPASQASSSSTAASAAASAAPAPRTSSDVVPLQEQLLRTLGMNIELSVDTHELRISLDGEDSASNGGPVALYGSVPTASILLEHEEASVSPKFALTWRHIQGSIHINVASSAVAAQRPRHDIFAVKLGVRTMDFIKVAPGGGPLKRLVSTAFERDVADAATGGRSRQPEAIHVKASIVSSLPADDTDPEFSSSGRLCSRDECKISVAAEGVHFCIIPEHIAESVALLVLYAGSFKSAGTVATGSAGTAGASGGVNSVASSPSQFMRRHPSSAPVATATSVNKFPPIGAGGATAVPVVASVYATASAAPSHLSNYQHASVNPSSVPLSYSSAQGAKSSKPAGGDVGAVGKREGGRADRAGAAGAKASGPAVSAPSFALSERSFGLVLGLCSFRTYVTVKNCDLWLPIGDGGAKPPAPAASTRAGKSNPGASSAAAGSTLPQVPALHVLANLSLVGEYEGHESENPWGLTADYANYRSALQSHGSGSSAAASGPGVSGYLDDYYDKTNGVFRCQRSFYSNAVHLRDITVEWTEIPYPEMFSNVFGEGTSAVGGGAPVAKAAGPPKKDASAGAAQGKSSLELLAELHDTSSQRTIVKPFHVAIQYNTRLQATLIPRAGVLFSELVAEGETRGILSYGGAPGVGSAGPGGNTHRFSVGHGGLSDANETPSVSPAFTANECVRYIVDHGIISVLHDVSVHVPAQQSNCGVEVNLCLNLCPWVELYRHHLPLVGLAKTVGGSHAGSSSSSSTSTGGNAANSSASSVSSSQSPIKGGRGPAKDTTPAATTPNRAAPGIPQHASDHSVGHAPEEVQSLLDLALLAARTFAGDMLPSTVQLHVAPYKVNMYVVNNTNVRAPTPIPLCKLVVENRGTTVRSHSPSFLNAIALRIALMNKQRMESMLQLDGGVSMYIPSGSATDELSARELFSGSLFSQAGQPVVVPDEMRGSIDVAACMMASVYYVNQQLMMWEPLVEPFRTDYRFLLPHSYPFESPSAGVEGTLSHSALQQQHTALVSVVDSLTGRVSTVNWRWTVPVQSVQFRVQVPGDSSSPKRRPSAGCGVGFAPAVGMRSALFERNVESEEEEEEVEPHSAVDAGAPVDIEAPVTVDPNGDGGARRNSSGRRGRRISIRSDRHTGVGLDMADQDEDPLKASALSAVAHPSFSARDVAMICSPLLFMHAATVVNVNLTIAFLQMVLSAVPSLGRHMEDVSHGLKVIGQEYSRDQSDGSSVADSAADDGSEGVALSAADSGSAIPDAAPSTTFAVNNDTGMLLSYWSGEDRRLRRQTESIDPLKTSLTSLSISFKMSPARERGRPVAVTPSKAADVSGTAASARVQPVAVTYGDGVMVPTAASGFTIRDIGLENRGYRLFKIPYIAAATALTESIASNAGLAAIWQEAQRASRRSNPSDILIVAQSDYEDCVKTLSLRSTLKLENNSPLPLLVQLVLQPSANVQLPLVLNSREEPKLCTGAKEFESAIVLWEKRLKPQASAYVPAYLCDVPLTRFVARRVGSMAGAMPFSFVPTEQKAGQDSYVSLLPPPPFDKLLKPHPFRRSSNADESLLDARAFSFDQNNDASTAVDLAIAGAADDIPLCANSDCLRFRQSRKSNLDMVVYSHWMSFTADADRGPAAAYINALISTVGIPHGGSATSSVNADPVNASTRVSSVDECALRTVSFEAPTVVTNGLGSRVRIELGRGPGAVGTGECMLALDPGQSEHCLVYHSSQRICLRLQLQSTDEDSSEATVASNWSTVVVVEGCSGAGEPVQEVVTLKADVVSANAATLTVLVEVRDMGGVRSLTVYTPYWIVTASPLVVQYQHDVSVLNSQQPRGGSSDGELAHGLNGRDGLCANQSFRLQQAGRGKHATEAELEAGLKLNRRIGNSAVMKDYFGSVERKRAALQGSMAKARGYAGVKLGPEYPIRGLVDILRAPDGSCRSGCGASSSTLLRREQARSSGWETPPSIGGGKLARMNAFAGAGTPFAARDGDTTAAKAAVAGASAASSVGETGSSFKIVHCGYTDSARGLCRLRLRAGFGTTWSAPFTPDSTSFSFSSTVSSVSTTPDFENAGKISLGKPVDLGVGQYQFSLGMVTQTLEPPFHRTAMVLVVDRFTLINKVDHHTLEIRQLNVDRAASGLLARTFRSLSKASAADGSTSIATLKPNEESSLWWRPNKQKLLQVRVSGDGWGWSGRFSITQQNSSHSSSNSVYEVPIRLRNEHDNTVFFLLAQVVHKGPRVSVVFKGGEHVAPYRLENHTLLRFRVRQRCEDDIFSRSSSGSEGSGKNTIVLPYHACFYAWDEPLEKLELLLEYQKSSDRDTGSTSWKSLKVVHATSKDGQSASSSSGISFSKLQEIELVEDAARGEARTQILAVVLADGPVRVLQFHENWTRKYSADSVGRFGLEGVREGASLSLPPPVRPTFPAAAIDRGKLQLSGAQAQQQSAQFRQLVRDFFFKSSLLVYGSVQSVGVSILDRTPQELLYMSVHRAELIYSFKTAADHLATNREAKIQAQAESQAQHSNPQSQTRSGTGNGSGADSGGLGSRDRGVADSNALVFNIQHFQIDSQLWNTPFPCLLYPTTTATATANAASLLSAAHPDSSDHSGSSRSLSAHNSGAELSLSRSGSGSHIAGLGREGRLHARRGSGCSALVYRPSMEAAAHGYGFGHGHDRGFSQRTTPLAAIYGAMLEVLRLSHNDVRVSKQFLQLRATQEFSYSGIVYIKALSLDIAPFDLNLESTILFKLKDFGLAALDEVKYMSKALKHEASLREGSAKGKAGSKTAVSSRANLSASYGTSNDGSTTVIPRVNSTPRGHLNVNSLIGDTLEGYVGSKQLVTSGNKMYMERLDISDMRFNVSLNPIKTTESHERIPIVNRFALALLSVTKMDNVNFKINKLSLANLYANGAQLTNKLESHYAYEAISNIPNVLLSFELFGNPYKFFKSLRQSVEDFLYLPYMGLFTSPFQFINGIWRGTTSLLRGTVASVLSSVGRIASVGLVSLINSGVVDPIVTLHGVNKTDVTIAPLAVSTQNLGLKRPGDAAPTTRGAALGELASPPPKRGGRSALAPQSADSLYDAAFSYYSNTANVGRPKGLLDALYKGVLDGFYCSIFCYRARGLMGVFVAVAPMVMGLLGKTSYGLLSLVNSYCVNLSYQLQPQVRSGDKYRLMRVRPPRYMHYKSKNEVLRVYSRDENLGQEVIARVSHGKFRVEGYDCHFLTATVTRKKNSRADEIGNVHPLYNNHNNAHHRNSTAHSTTRDMALFTSIRLVYLAYNLNYYDMLFQIPFKDIITVELRDRNVPAHQDDAGAAAAAGETSFTPDRSMVLDNPEADPDADSPAAADAGRVNPFGTSSEYDCTVLSAVPPQSFDFPPSVALFHFADNSSSGGVGKPRGASVGAAAGLFSPIRGGLASGVGGLGSPGPAGLGMSGGLSLVVNYVQFESHVQTAQFLRHLLSVIGDTSSSGAGAASMHSINSGGRSMGTHRRGDPAVKEAVSQYVARHLNDRAPQQQQHSYHPRPSSPPRDRTSSQVVTSAGPSSDGIFH